MWRWLVAVLLVPAALAQPKWTLQYFYDQDGKEFHITDLAFPSATRGIAVGAILDEEGRKPEYTALVTNDGGAHWAMVPLKEFPRSIFFLNDSVGWMVTGEAIWFTQESGRSWTRISDQIKPNRKLHDAPDTRGILLRVRFLDEQHGYAVGLQKSVYETRDGGHTWTPVEEAAKPASNPAYSIYTQIAFADAKRGIIMGGYVPPRRDRLPDWMTPEQTMERRQQPLLAIELDTHDGGATWTPTTAPIFGSIETLRLAGKAGVAVFSYADSFPWPSEVYRLDLTTGKSATAFRQKDRNVTDALVFPDPAFPQGRAFLAAVEPPGRLRSAPIPGKVKLLTSTNWKDWTEMDVDYRAVARSVMLAGPDAGHLWAATDTGMILRLQTH
jgi:hypothetical protein